MISQRFTATCSCTNGLVFQKSRLETQGIGTMTRISDSDVETGAVHRTRRIQDDLPQDSPTLRLNPRGPKPSHIFR